MALKLSILNFTDRRQIIYEIKILLFLQVVPYFVALSAHPSSTPILQTKETLYFSAGDHFGSLPTSYISVVLMSMCFSQPKIGHRSQ